MKYILTHTNYVGNYFWIYIKVSSTHYRIHAFYVKEEGWIIKKPDVPASPTLKTYIYNRILETDDIEDIKEHIVLLALQTS